MKHAKHLHLQNIIAMEEACVFWLVWPAPKKPTHLFMMNTCWSLINNHPVTLQNRSKYWDVSPKVGGAIFYGTAMWYFRLDSLRYMNRLLSCLHYITPNFFCRKYHLLAKTLVAFHAWAVSHWAFPTTWVSVTVSIYAYSLWIGCKW